MHTENNIWGVAKNPYN